MKTNHVHRGVQLAWTLLVGVGVVLAIAWFLEAHGALDVVWRNWFRGWMALSTLLLLALLSMSTVLWCWKEPLTDLQEDQRPLAWLVVLSTALAVIPVPWIPRCLVFGGVAATCWTAIRVTRWMGEWRTSGAASRTEHFREALGAHGRRCWGKCHAAAARFGADPTHPTSQTAPATMSDNVAVTGGIVALLLVWFLTFGMAAAAGAAASGGASWATHRVAMERSQRVTAAATAAAVAAQAAKKAKHHEEQVSGEPSPDGRADGTTPTSKCSFALGDGPDVNDDVAAAAETAAYSARELRPCGKSAMSYLPDESMYEQQVLTRDGQGTLVVWAARDQWEAVLISADDTRGYRRIPDYESWRDLGKPWPFVPCDGLWIQPFQSESGTLAGIGVRSSNDLPGKGDEPVYMWGAGVEALIGRPAGILRLPAGQPTDDSSGAVQHVYDDAAVRAPHVPAIGLTIDEVIEHCRA